QGRRRAYDAYVPPKMTVPMSRGPLAGRAVDPVLYAATLAAYYRAQGWTEDGVVGPDELERLGAKP
ncbi:MAG TPA: aldehyde ferredoxin oxidoreductase C-terminal domain-containing protein, partial [Acidobacteriota bacterium]|nr:aldehyde ferredoxin oxidoreductase C-terminal domain-containing protein [Acidobacteriota bacterium]